MSPVAAIPAAANLALTAAVSAAKLGVLFGVPLLLASSLWWGLLLLPLTLATGTLWALIHEAVHANLLPGRRANEAAGRLLGVLFGAPFHALRLGHLLHHRFNRSQRDRTEVYDPARRGRAAAALGYYPRLVGGLYLGEVLLGAALWLPRPLLRRLAARAESPDTLAGPLVATLAAGPALAHARADAAVALGLLAAGAWAWGEHAWMLAAAVLGRAFLVSATDNLYHYGTALAPSGDAANLRLPRPLGALLLNFHLHGTHHRAPRLPWNALPARFAADGGRWDGHWLTRAAAQFRGPIAAQELPRFAAQR